jgi:hypothetical protein
MGGKFSPWGLRGGYLIGWQSGDGGQIRPVESPWILGTPPVSQTEHLIYKEKTLAPPLHSFPLTRSLTAAFYFPQIASGASATEPWHTSLPTSLASSAPSALRPPLPVARARSTTPRLLILVMTDSARLAPQAPGHRRPSVRLCSDRPPSLTSTTPHRRYRNKFVRRRWQGSLPRRKEEHQASMTTLAWRSPWRPGGYRVPGVGRDGGRFPTDSLAGIGGDGDWWGSGRGRWSHTRPYPSPLPPWCHIICGDIIGIHLTSAV